MNRKNTLFALFFIGLLLLSYKLIRFHLLAYTMDDLFISLEGASSWIDGRPLLYTNRSGVLSGYHNYFFLPTLGYLFYHYGAYGAFLLQSVLAVLVFYLAQKTLALSKKEIVLFTIMLLFNPFMLWMFDHPSVGWSVELLIFPFAIFFAYWLTKPSHVIQIVSGLLLISIKEDAIPLLCLIHLSWFLLKSLNAGSSGWKLLSRPVLYLILLFWLIVFGCSLWFISLNSPGDSISNKAMSYILQSMSTVEFWFHTIYLFFTATLLILPYLFIVFWISKIRQQFEIFVIALIATFIIFIVTFYEGSYYRGLSMISMTWVPRISLNYAYLLSFILLLVWENDHLKNEILVKKYFKPVIVGFTLFFQVSCLYLVRDDFQIHRVFSEILSLKPSSKPHQELVKEEDLKYIRELEKRLPKRSSVYVYDYLTAIFHRHYIVFFGAGNQYEDADISILPKNFEEVSFGKEFQSNLVSNMKPRYKLVHQLEGYNIYATEEYKKYITN